MTKIEDKYHWMVGTKPPVLDQHSAVKHAIVESYVYRYIKTVMAPAHIPKLTLTLVDGFCGGGQYLSEDGQELLDGTPLLMLKAVQRARIELNLDRHTIPRIVDTEYFFVDKNSETIRYLDWHIAGQKSLRAFDIDDSPRVRTKAQAFNDALPDIVNRVKARKGGGRVIFLLDQYSYTAVSMETLRWLMAELPGAEIILNFNVDSMFTYLSQLEKNRKPLRAIGLEEYMPWEQLPYIKSKTDWRTVLQRHVAHGIKKATGAPFMTLFFVRPSQANSWSYWLVHLSRRYKAHDVMKQLHWEHSSEFGHELEPGLFLLGYNPRSDEIYSRQSPLVFGPDAGEQCVSQLVDQLGRSLSEASQPISLQQFFQQHISDTMADESRLQMVVRRLHSAGNIIVSNKDSRLRRVSKSYALTDVIEHSRQIIIF
ncbi:three-Cys-motif partner protein TcmP [Paraburkholderia humisilvae]|uniref:GMT-like wHTH domain-containing protein n=1 Tax=Paraburkholderia humisilvae TaxID=627669 RepID=A0A6J5DN05_9BURK|nr:three-Cys-motif partner protein TcmP [Paraburkholderia humisilvae]CAB3755428.1 hypothetical protein LMG29542_02592 [Paraburkholderia humisilvae]